MAKKIRAALTLREVAIRDFYDVDHAVRGRHVNLLEADLVKLITPATSASSTSTAHSTLFAQSHFLCRAPLPPVRQRAKRSVWGHRPQEHPTRDNAYFPRDLFTTDRGLDAWLNNLP
jgi:hypothetical protein